MIHGGRLKVFKSVNGRLSALVALAKSCTITHNCEAVEVSPTDGGKHRTYIEGMDGWRVDVSGLMSSISDLMKVGTTFNLEISDGSDSVTGQALCTEVIQAGTIGNLAQQSAVFVGIGALT